MTTSIKPPYPAFAGADGQPLDAGYIWIGAANLDPQTNPVAVYWDAALTIAAAQPIRTLAGYPSNSGTPARIYTGTGYSIRVQDSKGSTVYSALSDNAFSRSTASNATGDGVQTSFSVPSIPSAIYINGVYQNKNTYTLTLGGVTFSEAPPQTAIIEFVG